MTQLKKNSISMCFYGEEKASCSAHFRGDSSRMAADDVLMPISNMAAKVCIDGRFANSDWMARLTTLHNTWRSFVVKVTQVRVD